MAIVLFAPVLALLPQLPLELAAGLPPPALSPALLPTSMLAAGGSTVNAPDWVLPVAAACTGLIPLTLLVPGAIAEGEAKARSAAEAQAAGSAATLPEGTRLRRERLLARLSLFVQPTPLKGNGLFARTRLNAGAYIFDYEGELLDLVEYHQRYPGGVSDYTIGIKLRDGQMRFIDGADPLRSGLARFINHSSKQPNVKRCTVLNGPDGKPRVLMYTSREIEAGEELLWDYGKGYTDSHPGMVEDSDAEASPASVSGRVKAA